jgi:hypothetical protein
MKTTSINRKLVLGLTAIIMFFIAQAAAVLAMGRYTERAVVDVARRNTTAQVSLAELSTLAQQIRRYEKEYFIYVDNPEKRAQYQKEWTGAMDQISKLLARMQGNADQSFSNDDASNITRWWQAAEFYKAEMGKVFEVVEERARQVADEAEKEKARAEAVAKAPKGKEPPPPVTLTRMITPIEANGMIAAGKDRFSADLIKGVTQTFGTKSQATLALTAVTNEGFSRMIYSVIATVAIGVAIGLYLLLTLPRSVSRPIEQLTGNVDAISRGDTGKAGAAISVREFQGLSSAIERMRVAQEMMMQRLRKNS